MILNLKSSKKDHILDITDNVQDKLQTFKQDSGICFLNALHTTVALTIADLDPGTDQDILDACRNMIPKLDYRHPHDPSHAPDHILSALIGTDLTVQFENNKLLLGTWQRIILIDFNGPQKRKISLKIA